MDDPASFGPWLRERRRARDLSRQELARRVGCAVVTVKKIETGERRPSRQIAELVLDALAVPPEERSALVRLARATPAPAIPAPPSTPLSPADLALEDLSGRAIRGYTLRQRIGAGGFGVVYRAEQLGVGRAVAIKIILPQFANHPEFIRRFEAEAQIIARLEHPHIIPLYDYWREPGGAYLVMRYVSGGTLQAALQRAPLPLDASVRLLEQIGAALNVAHRASVIHRDLKPSNILLDSDGNAYLADFGIAKDLGNPDPASQTQPGAIIGSAAYLAPEQVKDEPLTTDNEQRTTLRFLAVVGPSGSGKSSVVRAGLIPALRRGGLPDSERWFVAELLPGAHPLEELELALLRLAAERPANLAEQLARRARPPACCAAHSASR